MSKSEHIRIVATVALITLVLSISGIIQGLEILSIFLLGTIVLYFSFIFITYVYKQKGYPVIKIEKQEDL